MNNKTKFKSLLVEKDISVKKVLGGVGSYFDVEDKSEGSIKEYQNILEGMDFAKRLDFAISSLGYASGSLTIYSKMTFLTQLVPIVCPNYNLMLLGAAAVGKSSLYNLYTNKVFIHSGMPSSANWRGNIKDDFSEALLEKEVVIIEEIADDGNQIKEQLSIIKQAMESSSFLYKNEEKRSTQTSIAIIANNYWDIKKFNDLKSSEIFKTLPNSLKDKGFLERFNSVVYKDDKFKLSQNNLINYATKALNVNFFYNTLFLLRQAEFSSHHVNLDDVRDAKRVSTTLVGYLKLLYPKDDAPQYVIDGLCDFAIHFRYIGKQEYSPFRGSSIKFILEGIKNLSTVEKVYLCGNRLLVKYVSGPFYYKVALNEWGLLENRKEIEFAKVNINEKIAKIDIAASTDHEVIQDFYPLAHQQCCYDNKGNFLEPLDTDNEDIEFNNTFINLIKMHAINELGPPVGELRGWKSLSEDDIRKEINQIFKASKTYINKDTYSYSGGKFMIINFSAFI